MGGSITIDATPGGEDADVVAIRLRAEMHSAVTMLRAQFPQAFSRWQQRRADAARAATTDRHE